MNERFKMLDLLQESVVIRDLAGRILHVNRAAESLYGSSNEMLVGRAIHEALATDRKSVEAMEAALREQGSWEGEIIRRTRGGIRLTVRVRHTRENALEEIMETSLDMTDLHRFQDALNRAEHRYYNVFQAMSVSFWELDFTGVNRLLQPILRSGIHDLEQYLSGNPKFVAQLIRATRVIDVNDQSVRLFGRGSKQEMLASLEPYWPAGSHPVYAAAVVAAMRGERHFATETCLSAIDGRKFDVWFTASFPPDMVARGKLLIGIVDISEDKKAKNALESSEQRYRTLFHFLPVAMVQIDRTELAGVFDEMHNAGVTDLLAYFEKHPDFYEYASNAIKVVEVNRRAVDLYKVQSEQALLGPVSRLWSGAEEVIKRSMAARFSGASKFEAEMKIRTFDDEIREVLYVAYFPEAFRQGAVGLSCLVDISDRVKAQATLAKVQGEFAHAARVSVLGELTASIAHEVNQPLGAILTNSEAALRWLRRPEPDIKELRALSERTAADAQRAADIIRRIREMATRAQPEQTSLSLNSVVHDVMVFLRPELRHSDVDCTLALDPELPIIVADRVQLQQVFANLAVNAIHAMQGQPERRLTIRTFRNGQLVSAEVDDTGSGIGDDQLPKLFQSFFTSKKNGMGIGLAICRSIIEAHGGTIAAENLPLRGARFHFALRMADVDSVASS